MNTRNFLVICTFLVLLFCFVGEAFGQIYPVYDLENRLIDGDKSALFQIASYLDSNVVYIDSNRMDDDIGPKIESKKAIEVLNEICLFTHDEIEINDSTSAKQFLDFLNLHKEKIYFSNQIKAFLLTPLDKREIKFEIRILTASRKTDVESRVKKLFTSDWIIKNRIDQLIAQKDPDVLLIIASILFRESRFNEYYTSKQEFIDLLQFITGTEIGVENWKKKIIWSLESDYYYPESTLNLLIFFSKFYTHYSWDEKRSLFVNPNLAIGSLNRINFLFQTLESKNDSIAINAFIQLTTCDTAQVIKLADEYDLSRIRANNFIPMFPYKFLKQLVRLTEYCKTKNIDHRGSLELQKNISLLRSDLTFAERHKLENELINSLSLDDVTAFEYWALIYEESWGLTFSAGRILDVFYSKHWNAILENKKYLDCYIKKSILFEKLGIIGVCRYYLKKFLYSSPETINLLNGYETTDEEIKAQSTRIVLSDTIYKKNKTYISGDPNNDYRVTKLMEKLADVVNEVEQDSTENQKKISKLLSMISYSEIPVALNIIENYPFKIPYEKYSFMERDWGFLTSIDFNKKEMRKEFLKLYSKYSEYQLYSYYLDQAGIDYKDVNNALDYDKIYERIKYDAVTAFVGGGGGSKDDEVYSLIKLLELTFKTTLGFPHKLCNSNNVYGCGSEDRAETWMKYLEDKKLLKEKHDQPISFHYKIK